MTNRETMELFIEKNGQETVAYPFVEKDHVVFGNGMGIEEVIEQDISMPTVTHEEVSFKVGVGDQDVSSSVVDSSVGEMVIKGQTYHNILPEPSTHVLTNNKEMFKVNEGLDPNVEIVDGVAKSAILKGQTLVNIINSIENPRYNFIDYNLSFTDNTKTYYVKFDSSFPVSEIGLLENVNAWNGNKIEINSTNGYAILTPNKDIPISGLRVRFDTNGDTAYIPSVNLVCIEYQDGMENWNIDYFEGMQSVKMPVLKATGKNLVSYLPKITVNGLTFTQGESISEVIVNGTCQVDTMDYYIANKDIHSDLSKVLNNAPVGTKFYLSNSLGKNCYFGVVRKGKTETEWSGTNPTTYIVKEGDSDARAFIRFKQGDTYDNEKLKIQLEVGTETTDYEPHKTNILTVNEEVELRGIGDVRDTLDLMTGELTQRIGEVVLDGSEDERIGIVSEFDNVIRFTIKSVVGKTSGKVASNKFTYADNNLDTEHIRLDASSPNGILQMYISKNRLPSANVDGFKEYLRLNPITIQYQLATESIKTVDLSSSGNWEKVVLDGSEDEVWHNGDPSWANKIFRLDGVRHTPNIMNSANALVKTGLLFSSHFEEKEMNNLCNLKPQPEGVSIYGDSIFVGSPQISTIGELRTWLSQNPITVWYQTTTTLDSTQVKQPIFFKDGHIQLSSGVDNSLFPTLNYQAKTSNSYVMDLMKTNTKYTMKAKSASGTFTIDGTSYGAGTNGTFTTPSSMTNKLLVMSNKTNEEVMILEGDETSKTIPYFKGIKSAFEGEDKIEVLSQGKNLADVTTVYTNMNSGYNDRHWTIVQKDENGFIAKVKNYPNTEGTHRAFSASLKVYVEPNTTYYLSYDTKDNGTVINSHTYVYSNCETWGRSVIKNYTEAQNGFTFTTHSDTEYIVIGLGYTLLENNKEVEVSNLILSRSKTTYEPYKSNSTKIPLLSPLRSLPNGTCDELIIDRMKKKVTLIQRVEAIPVTSVDDIRLQANLGRYNRFFIHKRQTTHPTFSVSSTGSQLSNWCPHHAGFTTDSYHFYVDGAGDIMLFDKSETLNSIRTKMSQSPFVALHQLATPIVTEVDLEGFPYIYKNGHIFLNSEIAPTTQITYSISQQHQIDASTQDLIRHEQEIDYLYKLIAQYIQVDYQSTLLSLDLKLK